ncbi:Sec-independent protein translocase protein TatB [Rhodobacteraceae bacterium HSP-20]|uniref:Sec-independent protein translocase protein TatB n=1 Tax=Paragemmobacter amnigenus TaxID=2852097 RepID=A0ABS6J8A3_9RHOB|nr:Sec-independent protein translocase protein TatB [Rhodobacter amnigenus]MBU9698580.1 Sec-independent protein translocase protein TatB [Rhodobacter amnigenus]MBV4389807.1 Sec-independent protein translocase protein TatB [Rhodobacter amnigenus]
MEIGWTELLVIGVVALIVIGPKDLPEMFRTLGRFTAKARSMAREFSRAMEQAAKETGVDDVARDLKNVASPRSMGLDAVKTAADKFEKWDPLKNAAKPTAPAPMRPAVTPAPAAAAPVAAAADLPPVSPAEAAAQAAAAAPVAAAPPAASMGPATAALAEKQAQRKAIAKEAAEKLRAVSAGDAPVAAPADKPKPPRKPRAKKAADTTGGEE